jgi:hypothetical protein
MAAVVTIPRHIRSADYFGRRLDFTVLTAAARKASSSPRIAFADIDGVLERCGHVLFLEAKCYRGAHPDPLPRGQEILLTTLATRPNTSVLILFVPAGQVNSDFIQPEFLTHFRLISGDLDSGIRPADFPQVETLISHWVRHAEAHPVLTPRPSLPSPLPSWAGPAAGQPAAARPADAGQPQEVMR